MNINSKNILSTQIADLGQIQNDLNTFVKKQEKNLDQKNFMNHLIESIHNVNNLQATSDKMATALSTGKTQNIHETMLAVTHAELSFNLMVQVRNKALDAYQEIMRMQV